MQTNFLYCVQFIQNYAENNKLSMSCHLDLIDYFVKTEHELVASSETFQYLYQLKQKLSVAKKKDWATFAEWKTLANVQKLKAYFQWVLPTEKWLSDDEVEGDVSYNTGFNELLNAMGIFENLCGVQLNHFTSKEDRVSNKLTAVSQFLGEGNNSVFKEISKASKSTVRD